MLHELLNVDTFAKVNLKFHKSLLKVAEVIIMQDDVKLSSWKKENSLE